MAEIRPFRCIRPSKEAASAVAALPYDVYDRKEAKEIVKKNPLSFWQWIGRKLSLMMERIPMPRRFMTGRARTLKRWQQDGI